MNEQTGNLRKHIQKKIKSLEINITISEIFKNNFWMGLRKETGDRSKVRCCKEQYCIGTWNVRSMNQGTLEVVKQEMARVKIDIVEIWELKWTGMGELNSDDLYIYSCRQESLRRNGVAI